MSHSIGERNGRRRPHIVFGVTSHQTCMLLTARAKALEKAGFRVTIFAGPGRVLEDAVRSKGITAHELPVRRGISLVQDAGSFVRILILLLRLKPDVVEFSTPKVGFMGSLAAWICRVPVRIYFLRGLRLETSPVLKRHVLRITERVAAACSHLVLCNSRSLMQRVTDLRIAPTAKLVLLGSGSSNGVDTGRFAPGPTDVRRRFGIPENANVIGFVGRLTCDKGLPELLEAFAEILHERQDTYLMLVGWFDAAEDALGCAVRERIESHPQVVFTGYVVDTAPFYRSMDLLVLPSWREGFPNAAIEAAATGVPVVSTLSTGACDAVVPEVTGLLVPPGYPEAICEACLQLLRNEERRRQMGAAARQWALQHFAQERVLGLTVEFYTALMREGRSAYSELHHGSAATDARQSM